MDYNVAKMYDYLEGLPKLLAEYDTDGTIKKYAYGASGERIPATLTACAADITSIINRGFHRLCKS